MIKRIQNRVAESRLTLPAAVVYGIAIWLLCRLVPDGLWLQLACFVLSTAIMVEINNGNALIRIYTRTVSCAFIVLSLMSPEEMPSQGGAIFTLCFVTACMLLFRTYQDKEAVGITFYASLCLGLASTVYVHLFYLIPLWWLLMAFCMMSLSWRTLAASIIGLLTPYWFLAAWYVYDGTPYLLLSHFEQLGDIVYPYDYSLIPISQVLPYSLLVVGGLTGIVHFLRNSFNDKIRIRQLFGFFIWMFIAAAVLLALQPQHYSMMIRIMVVCCSPLVAHFVSLTHTKITNAAFLLFVAAVLLITAFNLWTWLSAS